MRRIRRPVSNSIAILRSRDTTQEVCPWNVKFARELPAGSPYAVRGFRSGKDARTLAADILAMSEMAYRAA